MMLCHMWRKKLEIYQDADRGHYDDDSDWEIARGNGNDIIRFMNGSPWTKLRKDKEVNKYKDDKYLIHK